VIHVSRILRTHLVLTTVCAALLSMLSAGCGDKKTTEAPAASGAASPAAAGASQGKVTTGADPDKAPSYPNMYGKPAGSK
jgi:hypothetical protein